MDSRPISGVRWNPFKQPRTKSSCLLLNAVSPGQLRAFTDTLNLTALFGVYEWYGMFSNMNHHQIQGRIRHDRWFATTAIDNENWQPPPPSAKRSHQARKYIYFHLREWHVIISELLPRLQCAYQIQLQQHHTSSHCRFIYINKICLFLSKVGTSGLLGVSRACHRHLAPDTNCQKCTERPSCGFLTPTPCDQSWITFCGLP